jgi:polysaccharide biosynthesis transport protein
VGALKEAQQKIRFEQAECREKLERLQPKRQENQALMSNYDISVANLSAVSDITTQITENLRRLTIGSEYGQKTVNRLDLPQIGVPDGPYWYQYIGIGSLLGFVAFSGLAYLLEMADRSYRNPDEISADLGMPIVGHLPLATISRQDRIDAKVDSSVVTLHKNRAPISEAFRGIRTALFFNCQQSGVKVIQVTSPIPGDGKSTVAANIAVSISQSGRRVCLVDCDFRRPRVAKMFGLREDVGFVQVIGGKVGLDDAIQATSIENLSALTCGKRPANPAELLSSEVFGDLLLSLKEKFDFVIVDTPPMLAVSDPANVASHVDGVILTIRLRRNLRPIATRAAQMLHAINANMLGVVVNGIGVGGNAYGYGGYRYDNYAGGRGSGYGKTGYGGYGYGSTYQYGGYYGGTAVGKDYYDDSIPRAAPRKIEVKS